VGTGQRSAGASLDDRDVTYQCWPALDEDPLQPIEEDTAAMASHPRGMRAAATFVAGRATYCTL
jgi:hypothetical protein